MIPIDFPALGRPLAVAALLTLPMIASAQVTYFERPPTPDQLRAALIAPGKSAGPGSASGLPPGVRTRGIVWNASAPGGAPATAAASAAAPMPAPPPMAAAPAAAPSGGGSPAAALPITFDVGSARIDRASQPYIDSIASVLKSDPSLRLVIEGHTDGSGSFNRNMVLSWDRALGVFRTLVEVHGIDPNRLQPVGKGPMEPMPGTSADDGTNRRVQFRLGS